MDTKSEEPPKTGIFSKWPQIMAAFSVNLSILASGVCLGWPSPVISKLKNPDENPLHISITTNEEAWIGSLILIAAVFGPLYSWVATEKLGRKIAILSSALPIISGCIIVAVAREVWHIYVARVLWGLSFGLLSACVPMYVGEIADKSIRGALGSFFEIFISLGFLFTYSIGPFTSYVAFNIICIIPVAAFFITFVFMPESPNYLIAKGNTKKALKVLMWLRNGSEEEAHKELTEICQQYEENNLNKVSYFTSMKKKGNIKALYLAAGVFAFQQCSGINVVQFYLQSIFEKANTGVSAVLSAIIVGILQVLAGSITPFVVDRWGRRILLMMSALGMGIALGSLGLYFLLDKSGNSAVPSLGWLPVTSLVVFMVHFCLGFGGVSWALLGEIFDTSVKELNIAIISSFTYLVGFIVTRYYTTIDEAAGTHWGFWFFAIFCIVAFFFIFFLLPETKGKSMHEIQEMLNK